MINLRKKDKKNTSVKLQDFYGSAHDASNKLDEGFSYKL